MSYGLLGEKLGHSYSKEIHEKLAKYTYELLPTSLEEFDQFMTNHEFQAINVTIPYKEAVIPYLDEIDDQAKRIQAVNTIVNKNGKLIGHNTDFDGFLYMITKHQIAIQGKQVLVLGYGGAAKAVLAVLRHLQASRITIVNRTQYPETITLEEAYAQHSDVDVIVNTTSVGMYPNTNQSPICLTNFTNCVAVMDIIYNPLKTKLLLDAQALHMKTVNGLEMLVAQAKYAVEYFLDTKIDDNRIDEIANQLNRDTQNIVLIGMPSAGKTTIGKALSEHLQCPFVDIDQTIEEAIGMRIANCFKEHGEEAFRKLETAACIKYGMLHHQVIATGGGAIQRIENVKALQANGILIWIKRPLQQLISDDTRPLSTDADAIALLYEQRSPLYEQYADYIVDNEYDLHTVLQKFYTLIDHK